MALGGICMAAGDSALQLWAMVLACGVLDFLSLSFRSSLLSFCQCPASFVFHVGLWLICYFSSLYCIHGLFFAPLSSFFSC